MVPLKRRLAVAAGWAVGCIALAMMSLATLHAAELPAPLPGALFLLAATLAAYIAGTESGVLVAMFTAVIMASAEAPPDEIPHGVPPILIVVFAQLVASMLIGRMRRQVALAVRKQLASETQVRAAATASHAEQALRLVLDNIPQRVFWKDTEGRFLGCNAAFARDAGVASPAEVIGKTDFDMAWKEEAPAYRAADAAVLAGRGADIESPETQHQPDGSLMWLRTSKVPMHDADGRVVGVLGTYEDTTDQRRREAQLRIATNAQEFALEAVVTLDPAHRILSVNQAFTAITGYTEDDAIGRDQAFLRSEEHPAGFYDHIWEVAATAGRWRGELLRRHRDGSSQLVQASLTAVHDETGLPAHYVLLFGDISKARANEERVAFLAYHDSLTGLLNRVAFSEAIKGALVRIERNDTHLAVMFLNLDDFKPVNDALGHEVGDQLLQQVGARLSTAVHKTDVLARLGGDEFAVLLEGVGGSTECMQLAHKLLDILTKPYFVGTHELFVAASIGISLNDAGSDSATLLKNANLAMYEAKRNGKRRYHVFSANLDARGRRVLTLTNELHLALGRDELALHYQPKVSCCDGRIVGFEALMRWTNAKLGSISPAEFITIAENSGLIEQIGDWALRVACAQARQWAAQMPNIVVCVNVSARQLRIPDFADRVSEILRMTGLDSRNLELEITEGVFISEPEQAIDMLQRLRDLGVRLALDDFGTGYSSLSYLKRLPVNTVKIDQSFVKDLPEKAEDALLVHGITALAKALKLTVVAEGVETEEQRVFLCEARCDLVQGYLFGAPMPAVEASVLLAP